MKIDIAIFTQELKSPNWSHVSIDDWVESSLKSKGLLSDRNIAILNWCDDNIDNMWFNMGGIFIFENNNDAALFKLTWWQNG